MISHELLAAICAAAETGYPSEACGLLVGPEPRLVALDNVQDREHARDPARFPRTSRTAYAIDPLELLRALDQGGELVAIWHSHCDAGAYFSEEDVRVATGGGDEPLWPGVAYIVVSCMQGRAVAARVFRWDASARAFAGSDLPL